MSGVVAPHFTAFPTSIGLAATWDPAAVEEMADIIRRQMRAVGLLQALAPVMDVARDARGEGERDLRRGSLPRQRHERRLHARTAREGPSKGVLATAKHFLGYAVTEGGQNMAATAVGARELYDVHARPFEAAIRLAGLATVMPSYSEFDGVPISASRAVLTDMLRDKMGFTGRPCPTTSPSVSATRQRVAETPEEAGRSPSRPAWTSRRRRLRLWGGAGQGRARREVSESLLDRSVRRVLRDKFASACSTTRMSPRTRSNPHRRARGRRSVSAARRRIGDPAQERAGLLPLSRDIAKIAIIGPHADDVEVGFPPTRIRPG